MWDHRNFLEKKIRGQGVKKDFLVPTVITPEDNPNQSHMPTLLFFMVTFRFPYSFTSYTYQTRVVEINIPATHIYPHHTPSPINYSLSAQSGRHHLSLKSKVSLHERFTRVNCTFKDHIDAEYSSEISSTINQDLKKEPRRL